MKEEEKIAYSISGGLIFLIVVMVLTLEREKAEVKALVSPAVSIQESWALPVSLEEISGFAFLDNSKIAAVQDEKGAIFIYNIKTEKIEREIPFSEAGDYEGLAVIDSTAYVVESGGRINQIRNFLGNSELAQYATYLTSENDVEGLSPNSGNTGLLLALKGKDPTSEAYKGIYPFDLETKSLAKQPVYKLDFREEILARLKTEEESEVGKVFFPSEIAVHPETGKVYILEAEKPRILILNPEGAPLEVHRLDPLHFPQPEGMNFDPTGNLYISNEGSPATLHKIKIE